MSNYPEMTAAEKQRLIALMMEQRRRDTYDKFHYYYFQDKKISEKGMDISRKNYPKHLEFFKAGAKYKERATVAANRVGKTESILAYETTVHLTGDYPEWWEGKRFNRPVYAVIVGATNLQTRNVIQRKFYGSIHDKGTGVIPFDAIKSETRKAQPSGSLLDIYVQHTSGKLSRLTFLTAEMDLTAVMGDEIDVLVVDEEGVSIEFYEELLMRTMTTGGITMVGYTPLKGFTDLVLKFLPRGKFPENGFGLDDDGKENGRYTVNITWDDVPHLTPEEKEDMEKRLEPHLREARMKGIPVVGEGKIYPIEEKYILVEPFDIPKHWPRAYGLDPGWKCTAAIWGVQDPKSKVIYLYSEHYSGKSIPAVHAEAIKQRGEWITGAIDPASENSSGTDGSKLFQMYRHAGLNLRKSPNDIKSGIARILTMLESGQLKVMSHLQNWIAEYRLYHYDKNERVPAREQKDHLMDATKYLIFLFDSISKSELTHIQDEAENEIEQAGRLYSVTNTRNSRTGY